MDFQHFYSDVLAGIMIGVFFAVASFSHYRVYFCLPTSSKHSVECQTNAFGEFNFSPSSKQVSIQIDE